MKHTRILSNTAGNNGGGLYVRLKTAEIHNTVIALNSAEGDGGGIWAGGSTMRLGNVTLSTNSATNGGQGGGIYIEAGTTVTAINTTIALNMLGLDVYKEGDLTLQNSIIHTPDQPNCFFVATPINSLGHNLSDDDSCTGLTADGDQISDSILIEPLLDNGGNTLTHALSPNSVALDAGDNGACTADPINTLDHRGVNWVIDAFFRLFLLLVLFDRGLVALDGDMHRVMRDGEEKRFLLGTLL